MNNSKEAASPFLVRLWRESMNAANIVLSDLDKPHVHKDFQEASFRAAQVNALYGTLPLFVLSHIIVTATLATIAARQLHADLGGWWLTISYVPVLVLFVLWSRHDRKHLKAPPSKWEIHWIEILALLFGLVWAACPALFFAGSDPYFKVLMATVTLAASAVGTLAFSRVPAAAVLYCSLITGSLAISGTTLGGMVGITFAIFTFTYGLVLNGLVLNLHRDQVQREVESLETRKKNDIITLLLKDFEDGTADWLWETDAKGIITYASSRLAELTGKSLKELQSMTLLQAAGGDPTDHAWQYCNTAILAKQPLINLRLEANCGGRVQFWNVNAKPIFDHEQQLRGYRGVGHDMTAEHEIDKKLVAAKEEAEAAAAAKSHFLAVMSHELRTPLNSIVGFSEILAARSAEELDPDMTRDYASTILESSRHLQTLINDILDATRIENGNIALQEQEIDAAEIIEVAVKMCRDQAEKADVTLVANLVNDVELHADLTRIKQVVLNIVTNAIKFSPAGASVSIDVAQSSSGGFVLLVRDSGIGVRAEDIERIFDPFVQVEDNIARRFAGIGLGLSIARKIARLHGGDVTLDSQFGAGTTVRFELPASRVKWAASSATSEVAA